MRFRSGALPRLLAIGLLAPGALPAAAEPAAAQRQATAAVALVERMGEAGVFE